MSKVWDTITLGILVPSGPHWSAKFGMSLVGATTHLLGQKLPNCQGAQGYFVANKRGSILPQIREELVAEALERPGVTHLVFVDSDESFPPDAFWRLVASGHSVVGSAFPTKKIPSTWTAWASEGKNGDFRPVRISLSSPEYIQVARIGTGLLMLEAEVFRKLPRPWFSIVCRNGRWVGEDWRLCERLQEAEIPIWLDTRLSLAVRHIGDYDYSYKDIPDDETPSH